MTRWVSLGLAENAFIAFADQVNKVEEFPVVDEQMPILEKEFAVGCVQAVDECVRWFDRGLQLKHWL